MDRDKTKLTFPLFSVTWPVYLNAESLLVTIREFGLEVQRRLLYMLFSPHHDTSQLLKVASMFFENKFKSCGMTLTNVMTGHVCKM